MNFEIILTQLFKSGFETFNEADYEKLSTIFQENAQLISEEINLPKIYVPAVQLNNFQEIVHYWKTINENFENRITKYEFVKIGKISVVRCYYEKIDLIIDSEICFDNYAKIIKVTNKVVEP